MSCAVPDSPAYEPVIGIDYWPLRPVWVKPGRPYMKLPGEFAFDDIRTVEVREYAWRGRYVSPYRYSGNVKPHPNGWIDGCSWRFGYDLESDMLFVESPGAVDL